MNEERKWRQVRVFVKDFRRIWYSTFLKDVLIPFSDENPDVRFWFTKYVCRILGDGADGADTDPTLVPAEYFIENGDQKITLSIRIRFEANDAAEESLKNKITGFYSSFLNFDYVDGFTGERFYSGIGDRVRRADLVSELFYRNSLLVLDLVRHSPCMELNSSGFNVFTQSPAQSVLHILANIHTRHPHPQIPDNIPLYWSPKGPSEDYYPISQH
jgi:hypothetical protein